MRLGLSMRRMVLLQANLIDLTLNWIKQLLIRFKCFDVLSTKNPISKKRIFHTYIHSDAYSRISGSLLPYEKM